MSDQLDTEVKLAIYRITADTGVVPTSSEVARKIDVEEAEVLDAFARLHKNGCLFPNREIFLVFGWRRRFPESRPRFRSTRTASVTTRIVCGTRTGLRQRYILTR
jgi:hypothetical protein